MNSVIIPAHAGRIVNCAGRTIGVSSLGRRATWRYPEWGADGQLGIGLYDNDTDLGEYYNLSDNPQYAELCEGARKVLAKGLAAKE